MSMINKLLVAAVFVLVVFAQAEAQEPCCQTNSVDPKLNPESHASKFQENFSNDFVSDIQGQAEESTEEMQGVKFQAPANLEELGISEESLQDVEDFLPREAYSEFKENIEQQERIETYQANIWEHIEERSLFSDSGFKVDRGMVENFVDSNRPESDYEEKYLYLFLSSSIPEATLRNYILALDDNPHVAMILRGPIDSKDAKTIMPTLKWISKQTCGSEDFLEVNEKDCRNVVIDINPALFQKFDVSQVPALVYYPKPEKLEFCEEQTLSQEDYLKAYGDAKLTYMLDQFQISRPDDQNIPMLKGWLMKNFWNNDLGSLEY